VLHRLLLRRQNTCRQIRGTIKTKEIKGKHKVAKTITQEINCAHKILKTIYQRMDARRDGLKGKEARVRRTHGRTER